MRTLVVLGSFVVTYLLGAESINYIAVYGFGMIDPKFGDANGNYQVGREALRWLVGVASVSFVAGVWPHRRWFARTSTALLVVAAVGSALICTMASLAGLYLSSKLPDSVASELWPISWLVLFGLPLLCGRRGFQLVHPQDLPVRIPD